MPADTVAQPPFRGSGDAIEQPPRTPSLLLGLICSGLVGWREGDEDVAFARPQCPCDPWVSGGTREQRLRAADTLRWLRWPSSDGETEGNAYFDTLARLQLKFAVEENATADNVKETNKVNKNTEENRQDTMRTQRTTNTTPRTEERVIQETTQDTRRTDDTKKGEDRIVETTPQGTGRVIEGTPQNVETIEYVYVDGGTPATTVVNRIIPGSTSGLAKTGDETTLFPVYAAMVGVGFVVLAIAIRIVRKKRTEDEKGDAQ